MKNILIQNDLIFLDVYDLSYFFLSPLLYVEIGNVLPIIEAFFFFLIIILTKTSSLSKILSNQLKYHLNLLRKGKDGGV